jgi:hypothetical protein
VGDDTLTAEAPSLQWFRAALLVVIALCTYLHVPLVSGGRLLVPSFPTVALVPLLYLTVRSNISKGDEFFLPKIALVLLLSIAFSPGYKYVDEKFLGLIQAVMAIGVAVLIVRLMQQIRPELLERALLVLWCLIVGGSVLEVFGVIQEISDSFRAWAYGEIYTLYDYDLRDINMVGQPRPKLFSVEPSHVTKVFIASINSWLLVRVGLHKVVVVAGATVAMFVIMGSPMLLLSAAITIAIVAWSRRTSLRAKIVMTLAALILGAVFTTLIAPTAVSTVVTRLEDISEPSAPHERRANSEQQRIVYPYITLSETWMNWPIFGVGIAGKEVVAEHTRLPVDRPEVALGNNAMAELGIFLGLFGGVWFVYVFLRQGRETGVCRLGLMLILVALFSQLMGGIVSFQYWGFIALLWGALSVADSREGYQ